MDSKKPNYQDIAAEAGVSVATVSRILTGMTKVRDETREKVLAVMAGHGYDVSELRAIKHSYNNKLLIFNIPTMENPFYSQIARGAKAAANRHGFHLLVNEEHINNNSFSSLTTLIQKSGAAGLITANHVPVQFLKKLDKMLPLVQCCEFDGELAIPYVSIDDIAAAKTTMDYLFSLGRRDIAFINGPLRYKYARYRLRGYLESLEKAGFRQDAGFIIQLPDMSYDMAISAVGQLLRAPKKPDAFFCVSDVYAAAVIKSCTRLGIRVPGDIMVTGFDNVDISSMMTPAITTTNQPRFQLGFSSCELLVELINNPNAGVRNILLETELIIRESTSKLL
jgi:LacI family repressor for deo operon, udp, cdd, tsx, nupC, and nupG